MSAAVKELIEILDLEVLELNLFRGRSPQSSWQRVFGCQVIGQALVAACRTVDDIATRPPHSLHAYFLLGGDPKVPIIYEVDRIRDGRSFTSTVYAPKGSGQLGIAWNDIDAKFRALAPLGGLGGDAISRTLDIIHDFRRAAGVSPLLDLLRPAN